MALIPINRKGGAEIFYLFMLAVILFFLGLALAGPITEITIEQRANLDCGNSSISGTQRAVCDQVDLYAPFFIGGIFAIAGMVIGGKFIL